MKTHNRILLFCLLLIASYQQCGQTSQTDLLQSGSTFFYNSNAGSSLREHLFQFPLAFTPPNGLLQLTASSSNFQLSSPSPLSFQITASAGQNSAFATVLLLMGEDSTWSSVRVYYLASGRADFFLGTFSADIYLQQKYSSDGSLSVPYVLPGWSSTRESFTAIAQISGVRTTAASYAISLGMLSFDPTNGQLLSQFIINSTIPVQVITLSYIIFKNSAPFGFSTFDVMTSSSATYQFIGIQQLNNGSSIYSGYAFTSKAPTQGQISCVGSNCPSECINPQDCQQRRGQIEGQVCLLCGNGQTALNGVCQTTTCGANQYFNGTDCACFMGYLQVNSSCYLGCGLNAYINNSRCLCLPGYKYSATSNNCIEESALVCGKNYVIVNDVCVCPKGLGLIGNLCLACPANSYVSETGNCICNSGSTLNPATLACVTDCFANAYRNIFGQCVCNNGFYNTGTSCITVATCVNGQIWNGTACACPQGQITDSITQQCSLCNTPDRMISSGSCTCAPSYYPTDVGCSLCPNNSLYNITAKACQCVNGYYMQDGNCALTANCPFSSVWNPVTLRCDCTYFGNYVINGYCQPCPLNSAWNGTACACNAGFVANGSLCACPNNGMWNGVSCVCPPNHITVGGICTKCDVNAPYAPAQQTCICKAGWFGNYSKCNQCDSSCATCSGSNNNQCLTCASGKYLDSSNSCQPCGSNCIQCTDSSSCITCSTGYKLSLAIVSNAIVNICQFVPTNASSILTLRGQVTGNGVVYQGVALSLMPTFILANGCSICNNLLTVTLSSTFTTVTTSVQYVTNSQYWFVVTFNFGASSFIPSYKYSIQINPNYTSYFSSADMAQVLNGTGGDSALSTATFSSFGAATQANTVEPTFTVDTKKSNLKGRNKNSPSTVKPTSTTSSSSISSTSDAPSSQTLISLFG